MSYTVKQLADLAGVSPRTLHYYDQIRLLQPEQIGENGYRFYGDRAMLRLQQICSSKSWDSAWRRSVRSWTSPVFDLQQALQLHKAGLQERLERLKRLSSRPSIRLMSWRSISNEYEPVFEGFSEEKQKQYEQEIRSAMARKRLKVCATGIATPLSRKLRSS